ncbi:endonuclease NucS domain-containing protein [Thiothrix nivea]|uniref:Endonuclease NucS C-terminal domain-containing protein n=1 Tax=Thiothrix nivea (strain ATCC 35100 / DSM 5205 / JP2) TaxID=870187 RepID=A0A656HE86_THINJ|nr:endonuclease NucS domain-containing protein [Thiothrix nivea]EIJ35411.1 hypothetical protein Thini_2880 [Thiothrix nivea DSM 5205]
MPIEVGIWKIQGQPQKLSFSALESEKKLEDVLESNLAILSPDWLYLGRQIPTAHGKYIDILAMDGDGNLCVIELKRHKTPREAVAQLLDYASWVQGLSYDQVTGIYADNHPSKEFEQGFVEFFNSPGPPEQVNRRHQLVLVAAELDSASERIINYLSDNYGVPINALFFRYFRDGENEYLTRTWLLDPQNAEVQSEKVASPSKQDGVWNGLDYYVAYGDNGDGNLVWEDARQHGFVTANGGRWYTRTLEQLKSGDRVFACIPGRGYVGVGEVLDTVKPITEFMLEINGAPTPVCEAGLRGHYMCKQADDPETRAGFVRVKWYKTVPQEQAFWQKGMYANQNTVTKLRNRFTLEQLERFFQLQQD